MQYFELICPLVETLNALECQSVVRDVELFKIEIIKEHLLQAIISDMIVN